MIKLPNSNKKFEYENNFYLSSDVSRIGKLIAHYELYKRINHLKGDFIECGVFKGISLIRFASFRNLFDDKTRKIIGFDVFGKFPQTDYVPDKKLRMNFVKNAGNEGISTNQLKTILSKKGLRKKTELIQGDVTVTVPKYLKKHPKLKIAILNLDTDIYEPAVTILENFYPKIVKGGILILDDYGVFKGETKAVDDYFKGGKVKIQKFPFSKTPSFIIKK
jgi:hypothetical protein